MRDEVPIDGNALMLAGAKASVPPDLLPALAARAQRHLRPDLETYRRRYECVHEDDDRAVFLVPTDHWVEVGDALEFSSREADAVRRAHEEQLLQCGSRENRRDEFETALEIREAVVVGTAARDV
jgi:hypothetical protein